MTGTVICACGAGSRDALERPLCEAGFPVECCAPGEPVVEQVLEHRPGVVVYELRGDRMADLAVLRLLRRVAPEIPLVLITGEESLVAQRLVRDLHPVYYAVHPVAPDEIVEAVRAALQRRQRHQVS